MKFTYIAPTLEDCAVRLARFEAQRTRLGFAPWCIFRQDQPEAIGWGGLAVDPDEPHWGVEVLYAFAPEYWGRGYASELVDFSVQLAFNVLGEQKVSAFTKPDNIKSSRVLEKCGFSLNGYVSALKRFHYVANPSPRA